MKIGLGTVQFGLDYGVSNVAGKVPEAEAASILTHAEAAGIDTLDTSTGYGDAEEVLGRISTAWDSAKIVTKTPVLRQMTDASSVTDVITTTFERSLNRLGRSTLYGLMVHLAEDLLGPDGDEVWSAMQGLKDTGKVAKIGTSCYTTGEARTLADRYPLDLIQVPFNLFDQRMLTDGMLAYCMDKGVEVHTRSAFLQGLLLMDPDNMPDGFSSAERPLRAFRAKAEAMELSPLALALGSVLSRPEIDRVILGVTNVSELEEILVAAEAAHGLTADLSDMAQSNEALITPSMWPPDTSEKWSFNYSKGASQNDA